MNDVRKMNEVQRLVMALRITWKISVKSDDNFRYAMQNQCLAIGNKHWILLDKQCTGSNSYLDVSLGPRTLHGHTYKRRVHNHSDLLACLIDVIGIAYNCSFSNPSY